jgi:adenosine deaminase
MREILSEHISDLIKQHVVYSELILSPTIFPREEKAFVRALHRWHDWTREFERGKTQVEYLMTIPRTLNSSDLDNEAKRFMALYRADLIVGVALVGMETGETISRFSSTLSLLRDAGLGIEIHAGEHSGPESVYDAIKFGRPNRIGHCLAAFRDHSLLELIHNKGLHIEFCPTSNVRTAAVRKLKEHPIKDAIKYGLSFSINTDNPGAFDCSMQSECKLLAKTFGLTTDDFGNVFYNSLASRFKSQLRYLKQTSM